jgi:hypothetical protein
VGQTEADPRLAIGVGQTEADPGSQSG